MQHLKNFITVFGFASLIFVLPAFADTEPDTISKTPDGIAHLVRPDDSVLQPIPDNAPAPPMVKPDPVLMRKILSLSDQVLTLLSQKTDANDPQYYADGVWHSTTDDIAGGWLYGAGPAGLAAELWRYRQLHPETMNDVDRARQPWLKDIAIATFDHLLTDHQLPNGDFRDLAASHREFFLIDFITTYLIFRDSMDPDMKTRWLDAMRREVDFMIGTGDLPDPSKTGWKATDGWYTNGNAKYQDLLERDWKHTLHPYQIRWKDYGLFYFKQPTQPDGSDGSAFVTEAAAAPGFDREYGMLQLSIVARYYLKSRDPRALKVTNLLYNSLAPHIDPDTWILDALYGSRHSTLPPFSTCAPEILAWLGGRSDLLPILNVQFDKGMKPILLDNAVQKTGAPGTYRSYGFDLGALLEAACDVDGPQK